MLVRGKFVIVSIVLLAACAAGLGVWFQYSQARRIRERWGPEHAARIRNAMQVEAWRLASEGTGESQESPGGEPVYIVSRQPLKNIPDLVHIRRTFLSDAYFHWDEATDCQPQWVYALQFTDASGVTTLWLDDECDLVRLAETGATAKMNAGLRRSVHAFLDRYARPAAESPPSK